MKTNRYEVIIIGGSYSGLSAAMALGRSLRKVLIIDGGMPCNRQTPHSHNFLTHDGERPDVIAQKGKTQVLNYSTVEFMEDFAVAGKKTQEGFIITTKQGVNISGSKLIFATGIKDALPNIPGFSACWGKSIIHCPYCHGYEYRGKKTAIIANEERAVHLASLVSNLTNHITLLTSGKTDIEDSKVTKLSKHGIEIIETGISEIEQEDGQLKNIVFSNGHKANFDVAYADIPFTQHSNIPESLGCELTDMGHIQVDMFQKTTVPNIFACGDNASMMRSVAYAVSAGNIAGAMVNNELTEEAF